MSTRTALACSAALLLATSRSLSAPGSVGPNRPTSPAAPRSAKPSAAAPSTASKSVAIQSGRQTIDGIDYYYELHGAGEPLLLLHGGLGSIDMFGPVLAQLAENRRVIAVDLQGHGRTPLGTRPFQLESIGNDMAELVKRLGYSKLDMYQSYAAVAPKVEDFPRLLDALGDYMHKHYDWSAEVPQLKLPVLLVFGDGDMFRPEHEIKFYQLLGGGQRDAGWQREHLSQHRLAILPDLTHYDIFSSPRLATTVLPFLNGQSDAKSWAEQVQANRH